jgi:hypothetical protein
VSADRPDRPVPRPRPEPGAELGDGFGGTQTPAELRERLQGLRAQRLQAESEAAQLLTVLRAIALNRRARDAGSSPMLSEHRAHLERIVTEVEELVSTTTRIAVRLHLHGGDDTDPLVRRARRAIEQSQSALHAFSEAVNEA